MQLTQSMRDRIEATATASVFRSQDEAMLKREAELATRIIQADMRPEEWVAMNALPAKFFPNRGRIVISYGDRKSYSLYPGPQRMPNYVAVGGIVLAENSKHAEEVEACHEEHKRSQSERKEYAEQTSGVLKSYTSVAKLLEAWPTLREIMPEGFFEPKAKPQLPAERVNVLDEKLKASLSTTVPEKEPA